jgi:two-component system, cell cycle sensor histidine kinase and response regulator CckA
MSEPAWMRVRGPDAEASAPHAHPAGSAPLARVAEPERLEALGRLTAGIVHDFNNLLFVIIGQVEIARALLPSTHAAAEHLSPALLAAERAASLTRQLLAFGRGTSAHPRVLDLNTVVAQLDRMLRRVIGEDVEIELVASRGLWGVRADPIQMEQLLLNLALNARDAMPKGGRLRIETHNVESAGDGRPPSSPGRHVLLTVSDDGQGMDAATREHMFEPFFTTKPEGAGSGLGLATVLGIVERSGGSIGVDSEPEKGTTFRIYLPCADEPKPDPNPTTLAANLPGGSETILIVEDFEPVRDVTRALLVGLGYRLLTAAHGEEALAIGRTHPGPIHLLLTDLVMPGLPGRNLAERFAEERPGARILFMSGYADDGPVGGGPVLANPADQARLAWAVREVLDGTAPPRTGG